MPKQIVDPKKGLQRPPLNTEAPKEAYRRFVLYGDQKVEVRAVPPSKEALKTLGLATRRQIVGPIAINPLTIEKEIALQKADLLRSIAMMNNLQREQWLRDNAPVDFVKDKKEKGYSRYNVTCVQCGDAIAVVWAKDDELKDWCDLHYICEYDKHTWHGCMAVNVSPIDQQLGFECACGQDTRDYRTNKELPPITRRLMVEYILEHRNFGTTTSAYIALKK